MRGAPFNMRVADWPPSATAATDRHIHLPGFARLNQVDSTAWRVHDSQWGDVRSDTARVFIRRVFAASGKKGSVCLVDHAAA